MDKLTEKEIDVAIEGLIDTQSLTTVLDSISRICSEKADHIRVSYNDKSLANKWEKVCIVLNNLDTQGL